MRVAITTDWLTEPGGAERVLAELHRMFPDAPVFTTVFDASGFPDRLAGWDVRPSFLQRVPFARRRRQAFLPLMPLAFEQFDLRDFDLVISSSSACAKGVIPSPNSLHVSYCHTPCRYIWDLRHDYVRGSRAAPLVAPVAHWLRLWDRLSSDRVDHFVANSREVEGRIRRHYRRDAEVVHPPVDVERFRPSGRPPEDFYLVVSRLVAYKRIDLAVEAANRTGRRLLVVGDGPARRRLEAQAGPSVEFLGRQSDERVAELMTRCRAFLFPGFEDFGIAPVEAQAAGRPVLAFGRGGARETVLDGSTGVLFDEQSADALSEAMLQAETTSWDPVACRRNAERFDRRAFHLRFQRVLARHLVSAGLAAPSLATPLGETA